MIRPGRCQLPLIQDHVNKLTREHVFVAGAARCATNRCAPVCLRSDAAKLRHWLDASGSSASVRSGRTSFKVSLAAGSGDRVVTVSGTVSPM